MVLLLPEIEPYEIEYMSSGDRAHYCLPLRTRDPVYLLLHPLVEIEEEVGQIRNMGLVFSEVFHIMVGERWQPNHNLLTTPSYHVYGAVSFDTTALMTLKMLMMPD